MPKQSLLLIPIAVSLLAALGYPTTNAAATDEVSPLKSTAPAIPVAQNRTQNDANKQLLDCRQI